MYTGKPRNSERVPTVAQAIGLWLAEGANRGREVLDLELYHEIRTLAIRQNVRWINSTPFPPHGANFSHVLWGNRAILSEQVGLQYVRPGLPQDGWRFRYYRFAGSGDAHIT